jgi:hypothetical protein
MHLDQPKGHLNFAADHLVAAQEDFHTRIHRDQLEEKHQFVGMFVGDQVAGVLEEVVAARNHAVQIAG